MSHLLLTSFPPLVVNWCEMNQSERSVLLQLLSPPVGGAAHYKRPSVECARLLFVFLRPLIDQQIIVYSGSFTSGDVEEPAPSLLLQHPLIRQTDRWSSSRRQTGAQTDRWSSSRCRLVDAVFLFLPDEYGCGSCRFCAR